MQYRVSPTIASFLASLACAGTLSALDSGVRVWADFVYLEREKIHNRKLVVDDCATEFTYVQPYDTDYCCPILLDGALYSKDLVEAFGFRPGVAGGVEFMPCRETTYQFSGLYMSEWNAKKEVCSCFCLYFPFENVCYDTAFFDAEQAIGSYSSRYWQAEANYLGHLTYRNANYFAFAALMGLRYINLRESFDLGFRKYLDTANYTVGTQNDLYGVQIGANLQINPMPKLSFEVQAKVGYMVNWGRQQTHIAYTYFEDEIYDYEYDFIYPSYCISPNSCCVLSDFSAKKYTGSWLVDFSALLRYPIFCNLDIHAGYQLIYLTDLVLAPEQVDTRLCPVNETRIYNHGQIFLDGGFIGLGYSF